MDGVEPKWSQMARFSLYMNLTFPLTVKKRPRSGENFAVPYCLTACSPVRLSLAARNASVPTERIDAVRKLAASLQCPLLFAEDQVCTN